MLKLVIFDMDGLMLDTEQLYCRAFVDTCLAFGQEPRREIYLSAVGRDDESEACIYQNAFPQIGGSVFYDAVQTKCAELISAGLYTTKPGLFELLDVIERRGGLRTAVVTSNREDAAKTLLTHVGVLPDRLNGAVYREMVARGKPFPDPYLLCCKNMGVAPQEALVLEDSEFGIRAAIGAGIPVIAIPDLVEPPPDVLSRCLARCNHLGEVIPYLDRL